MTVDNIITEMTALLRSKEVRADRLIAQRLAKCLKELMGVAEDQRKQEHDNGLQKQHVLKQLVVLGEKVKRIT